MKNEIAEKVLDFWFKQSSSSYWFKSDKDFDGKIRSGFKADYDKALVGEYDDWQNASRSCLALILILDQFSRNLNRNSKDAFTQDSRARDCTRTAIKRGYLKNLEGNETIFALMPLIHSEDIKDHRLAMEMLDKHLKGSDLYDYIKKPWEDHTRAIERFSRYPHRNNILGRQSSKEELDFLKQPNSSW